MAPRRPARRLLRPANIAGGGGGGGGGGILASLSGNSSTPPRTLIVSQKETVADDEKNGDILSNPSEEEEDVSALSESSSDENDGDNTESEEEEESNEEGESDEVESGGDTEDEDDEDDGSICLECESESSFQGKVGKTSDSASENEEDDEEESDYDPDEEELADDDSELEADDAGDQELRPARRNKALMSGEDAKEDSKSPSKDGPDCESKDDDKVHVGGDDDDDDDLDPDLMADDEDELHFARTSKATSSPEIESSGVLDEMGEEEDPFDDDEVIVIRSFQTVSVENDNGLSTETDLLDVNNVDVKDDGDAALAEQQEKGVHDHSSDQLNASVQLDAVHDSVSTALVRNKKKNSENVAEVLVACDDDDDTDDDHDDDEVFAEIVDDDTDEEEGGGNDGEYLDAIHSKDDENKSGSDVQTTEEEEILVCAKDERLVVLEESTRERVGTKPAKSIKPKAISACVNEARSGVLLEESTGQLSSSMEPATIEEFDDVVAAGDDSEVKVMEGVTRSAEPMECPIFPVVIGNDVSNAEVSALCQSLGIMSIGQHKLSKSKPDEATSAIGKDNSEKGTLDLVDANATAAELAPLDRLLDTSMDSEATSSEKEEIFAHKGDAVGHKQADCRRFRREGSVKRGKWKLGAKIGSGAFGVVHVGMNTQTGTLMAVKSLKMEPAVMKDAEREIQLLRSLNHENIVRYLGAEMDSKYLHIFQEWVPAGSVTAMLSKFGPFPLEVLRNYLAQILEGLKYLHENSIMHRDIKGSNILVNDEGIVKLADFGASKRFAQLKGDMMLSLTMRGTPYFMAPEVFEEKYSTKADIWSVACVAVQMATGNPPWKNLGLSNPVALFQHISNAKGPPAMEWNEAEAVCGVVDGRHKLDLFKSLVAGCFQRLPENRPSASDLLNNFFFSEDHSVSIDDPSECRGLFSPESTWSRAACPSSPIIGANLSPIRPPVRRRNSIGAASRSPAFLSPPLPRSSRKKRATCQSPFSSPTNPDSTDWPTWAREKLIQSAAGGASFGKKPSETVKQQTMIQASNMSDSLAYSEDSGSLQRGETGSHSSPSGSILLVGLKFVNPSSTPSKK